MALWKCSCGKRFSARTGTILNGLRSFKNTVMSALHARSEGCGVRSTGRLVGKAHSAVIGWERRLASSANELEEAVPSDFEVTIESDELYTRVHHNRPASESEGWTACGIERGSRFCTRHAVGEKNDELFTRHTKSVLDLVGNADANLFSDGECRYASSLWIAAGTTTTLPGSGMGKMGRPPGSRKCLRKGVTVRRKVKGSQQGPKRRQRYETPLPLHPRTEPTPDLLTPKDSDLVVPHRVGAR